PSGLPPALQDDLTVSPPELYLDFTAAPGGLSQQMAAACVRRDLDAYGQFLASLLTLRQLDRYVNAMGRNPRLRPALESVLEAKEQSSPKYLRALLGMSDHPIVAMALDAQAAADEDAIREANRRVAIEEDAEDQLEWLDALLP